MADEAAGEVVLDIANGLMRTLLKALMFFRTFKTKSGVKLFCQVIQDVALSLTSGLWKKVIFVWRSNSDRWLLFWGLRHDSKKWRDKIDNMYIEESTWVFLEAPNERLQPLQDCLHFLVRIAYAQRT